jgi:hypothetical protein
MHRQLKNISNAEALFSLLRDKERGKDLGSLPSPPIILPNLARA